MARQSDKDDPVNDSCLGKEHTIQETYEGRSRKQGKESEWRLTGPKGMEECALASWWRALTSMPTTKAGCQTRPGWIRQMWEKTESSSHGKRPSPGGDASRVTRAW
jgi:hypothetical protein